ncbi:hypothetical protein [Bauldia sp.]|uniref:hypothetical protein n=1 Tax=Bauldia sp. TaxID=2575872 RepID=UPI003BA943B7
MAEVAAEGETVVCRWFAGNELLEGEFSRRELMAVSLDALPVQSRPGSVVAIGDRS